MGIRTPVAGVRVLHDWPCYTIGAFRFALTATQKVTKSILIFRLKKGLYMLAFKQTCHVVYYLLLLLQRPSRKLPLHLSWSPGLRAFSIRTCPLPL